MSPLPNSRIIPTSWSDHHARSVGTSMNATVTVGEPDGPAQPQGDDWVQPWTNDYTGPARIQALNDAQTQAAAGGQQVSGRAYLVQLVKALAVKEIHPGARIKVTACANDAQLVGQDLWVIDPQLGSERFTRDVVCSDNQTDAPSV
jgi:hypothetical protein